MSVFVSLFVSVFVFIFVSVFMSVILSVLDHIIKLNLMILNTQKLWIGWDGIGYLSGAVFRAPEGANK